MNNDELKIYDGIWQEIEQVKKRLENATRGGRTYFAWLWLYIQRLPAPERF
jgi:hypothetical protein